MQLWKFCADVKREVTIVRLQASAKNVEGWTLENRAFGIKYFIQLCQKVHAIEEASALQRQLPRLHVSSLLHRHLAPGEKYLRAAHRIQRFVQCKNIIKYCTIVK